MDIISAKWLSLMPQPTAEMMYEYRIQQLGTCGLETQGAGINYERYDPVMYCIHGHLYVFDR